MDNLYRYLLALLVILSSQMCWANDYTSILDDVEQTLSEREYYFDRQLKLIEEEESKLLRRNDKRERFDICYQIFTLSRSYKYDIAYKYSNEALNLALEIGDPNLILRALASKLSTFTSGGLFTEAADIIESASTAGVSDDIKREFFYNVVRYYSDQRDYASESEYLNRYSDRLISYADSIIELSSEVDYYHTYATAYKESTLGNVQKAIDALDAFYGNVVASDHHNSIITFLLANGYFDIGDSERGFGYLSKSMWHDTRAAAHENRSIKTLAQHLYDRGETKFSEELINVAFDDAKYYNARHRNLEINTLLPIINEQRIQTISRQRNILYILLGVISLLSVGAVVAVFVVHRTARRLQESKRIIEQQLESISAINNQLRESNNIKEHYVIESLYKKNDHLKQMESLLKKIDVKVKNRLYDDLRSLYKDFNLKHERENFFSDFDMAFLRLFPHFIEDYNTLFDTKDQIDISSTNALPPEVRIFALMRLGITDNERISQFLDLSINTIYTYKTKVKGRTIIPKEEFEVRILSIKLT
ncbi:MAG: DUF6377 domain-containing protein [Rikenellaceae bacterium]